MAKRPLLIGLAGGTAQSRNAVARILVRLDLGITPLFPADPVEWDSQEQFAKSRPLSAMTYSEARLKALEAALAQSPRRRDPGLIYAHVLADGEAQVLRAAGGEVWHLAQPFSSAVVMQRGELVVTDRIGGRGTHLDPEEALSEALLRRRDC